MFWDPSNRKLQGMNVGMSWVGKFEDFNHVGAPFDIYLIFKKIYGKIYGLSYVG
jgi:hypothetical protein